MDLNSILSVFILLETYSIRILFVLKTEMNMKPEPFVIMAFTTPFDGRRFIYYSYLQMYVQHYGQKQT